MTITQEQQEQIVAYVDGELAGDEKQQVAAAIAADPELAASAEEYRRIKAALGAAYGSVVEEPVPARLLSVLGAAASNAVSNIVALPLKGRPGPAHQQTRTGVARWALPLAATLLVGFLAGQLWLGGGASPVGYFTADDGGIVARAHLASALDNQLSGQRSDAAGDGAVAPAASIALSFRSADGGFCRVFRLSDAEAAPMTGVACREEAVWKITALAASGPAEPGLPGAYQPAGAATFPPAIAATIAGLIAGDPMGAEAEEAARRNGWR